MRASVTLSARDLKRWIDDHQPRPDDKGKKAKAALENDDDITTLDPEAVFLLALANAKADQGDQDADNYASQANSYVRSLTIFHTHLLVDERGHTLSRDQLRYRFDKARRLAGIAKADASGDARQAQRQLGHTSITTTERYLRQRRGAKVTPTK